MPLAAVVVVVVVVVVVPCVLFTARLQPSQLAHAVQKPTPRLGGATRPGGCDEPTAGTKPPNTTTILSSSIQVPSKPARHDLQRTPGTHVLPRGFIDQV
eukprot:511666-Prorocentrum_minimum.AAC.1